jgi:glycosyltransferase involved in cell wall biosynthesis
VLFVGKLVDRKRPLDALHAVAGLRREGVPVEMTFAGSGELQAELEAAARNSGVPAAFLGFVNQSRMPEIYAAADLIVLPSDGSETWGLAINEAMACGVPAVVSDAVGCGPDLVEPERTGAVFPLADVAALAGALKRVLAFDAAEAGQQIAARIALYSPERTADGVINGADRICRRRLLR